MRAANAAVLLSLSLVVAGAEHGHGHAVVHDRGVHGREVKVEVVTVTEVVFRTVTMIESSAPQSSAFVSLDKEGPQSSASMVTEKEAPSATPTASSTSKGGNPYEPLVLVANSAIVKNSCDYPVYINSEGNISCGPGAKGEVIAPNTTYTEKMRHCQDGGISLKLSKTQDMRNPMQFEYSVWPDKKTVSYDISYLDCMKNTKGEKDLSGCVGHEGGIQAGAGDETCPGYFCMANEWCDTQAYVVAEFDYKPGAPVGACAVEKGIGFEVCAGN